VISIFKESIVFNTYLKTLNECIDPTSGEYREEIRILSRRTISTDPEICANTERMGSLSHCLPCRAVSLQYCMAPEPEEADA
jgi:hypothetical protein